MSDAGQTKDTAVAAVGDAGSNAASATAAAAVARPDYLPETYWDATANAPKADALKTDLADLAALRTEKEARGAIPAKAEDYKIELPEGFEIPKGLEFKPDPKDPMFVDFQKLAADNGLTQKQASNMVGLYANMLLKQNAAAETARTAEMQALGANAATRVDAAQRWLNANLSEPQAALLANALRTKAGVEAIEALGEKLKGVSARGQAGNGELKQKSPGAEYVDDIGKPGTAAKILRAAHATH